MKIYTRTGDDGTTSLFGGKRVPKSDLRIEACGTVDELNAYIVLLYSMEVNASHRDILSEIQDRLFTIGAVLATDPANNKVKIPMLAPEDVTRLENEIDRMNEKLPPLTAFVLPGGDTQLSMAHIARTVCRRAERRAVSLNRHEHVPPLVIQYLNRLSDYLFVLVRFMASDLKVTERTWTPRI